MSQPLPARPSLRQLQIQAKELAREFKQSHPEALTRLRRHHPLYLKLAEGAIPEGGFHLHDAQLVIALEYGFESWPKLRAHLDRVTLRRLVEAVEQGDVAQARALLRQRPELVKMDMAENDEHRVLHYAVLRRDEPMVRALMQAGADAHKGIYPHRDATTAYVLAKEREFSEIVAAVEEEEQFRRETMSCPNATVSPAQDQLYDRIRKGEYATALGMLDADPSLAKACDRDGATPLHVACEEGALPVVDWLLAHYVNPRRPGPQRMEPAGSGGASRPMETASPRRIPGSRAETSAVGRGNDAAGRRRAGRPGGIARARPARSKGPSRSSHAVPGRPAFGGRELRETGSVEAAARPRRSASNSPASRWPHRPT